MTRAHYLVVAAMAALSFLLPGASAIAQQEADHFVAGVEKFQRGEYDQAIADLQRAVEQQPEWAAAWYYLGVAQFKVVHQNLAGITDTAARDYSPAQRSLTRAMELAPSRPGVRMYLGRILEDRRAFEDAKRLYREELALRRLVERSDVFTSLGRISYLAGDYDDALSVLRRVLADEPRYVEALYYVGLSHLARKDYDEALKSLTQCQKFLTDWMDRVYHLLRIHYQETDPTEPEKASQIVENWAELRKELWALRQARARPATKTLEEVSQEHGRSQEFALDLHLWPELNKSIGDAHLGLKDWAAARNQYRRSMRAREGQGSDDDSDAWGRIGRAYFMEGKALFEDKGLLLTAIEQFKAAEGDKITPDPFRPIPADPVQLLDGFARALYVAGINKEASLDRMTAPPEPDPVIARVFDGLGELYLYQANTYTDDPGRNIESSTHDDAIETFDKALLYHPTYAPAMLHKSRALISRGERATLEADKLQDFRDAHDLLEREALVLEPTNADLWAELARACLGLDDLDKATEAARQALLLDKKHLVALTAAGLVKYYRNQCVSAAQDFTNAIKVAPRDAQSFVNLGNALYGLRSWGRAQAEYDRALALIPETSIANIGNQRPYILYLIALTQHQRKSYERAVTTLGEALKLRTDFYDAYRLLAAAHGGLLQWRAAEEALRSALASAPRDDLGKIAATHAHLGEVYEVQGRYHEAIAEYRIALARDPNNIQAQDGLLRLAIHERRAQQPRES